MAKLWQIVRGRSPSQEIVRYTLSDYLADLASTRNGLVGYGSSPWARTEDIETSFCGYVQQMYKSNGVVFAIILARLLLFTEARFCWFEVKDDGEDGRPAGRDGLELLERPWPNAGTGELLARMEQDVSLGGNFYAVREPTRLRRLRPDWLTIVLSAPPAEAARSDVVGYWFHPGRTYTNVDKPDGRTDEMYLPDEICHWSPIPDPEAEYRGMSWLTPAVREVLADKAATEHKLNFFANGATLGPIISSRQSLTPRQFEDWQTKIGAAHEGVANAYRPLYLADPVDVAVRTADMRQLDFKVTQGAGETRLCMDGGVPPIIVGCSEGLASATYCLPGDSLVWAKAGPTPIRDLYAGDLVWSHVDNGLTLRRVNWQQQTGYKQVFTIRTRNRILRASGNHPVLVRVKGRIGGGPNSTRQARTEWRTVDQLRPGDRVVQVQHLPDEVGGHHLPDGSEATPDFLRWLGAYVGDGCGAKAHGRSSVQLCIPPADRVRDHYEKLTLSLFDGVHIGEGPRSFRFNNAVLARSLVGWGFGGTATTKRVPRWVFSLRRDLRLQFLAGLVDTDGSIDKRGTLKIQLANRPLVEDVKMLLVGCGIQVSNLYEQIYKANVLPNPGKADTYVAWSITSSSAVQVAQIPFDDWLYRERVEANAGRQRRAGQNSVRAGLDDCLGFFTVRSITPGLVEPVYDINVDEGASFVADGIVVHNSNYGMARRKFGDHWASPQWRSASQSLSTVVDDPPAPGLRLGVNKKGIAFLREDSKDAAEITRIQAGTIVSLASGGAFTRRSAIEATVAQDMTLLEEDPNWVSVQLQQAGGSPEPASEPEPVGGGGGAQ